MLAYCADPPHTFYHLQARSTRAVRHRRLRQQQTRAAGLAPHCAWLVCSRPSPACTRAEGVLLWAGSASCLLDSAHSSQFSVPSSTVLQERGHATAQRATIGGSTVCSPSSPRVLPHVPFLFGCRATRQRGASRSTALAGRAARQVGRALLRATRCLLLQAAANGGRCTGCQRPPLQAPHLQAALAPAPPSWARCQAWRDR